MPPPFVARYSRLRLFLLAALGAGFVAMALYALGAFGEPHLRGSPIWAQIWGWIALLFFGTGTIVAFRRMISAGDAITMNYRGLRARQWSDDFIPWTSIVAIERRKLRSKGIPIQSFLTLELADAEKYPAKRLSRLGNLNRFWGFGDVSFNTVGTDKSFREVADALERHWQHYRGSIPASKSS